MKVHHIAITVNSLNESLEFYREIFGFQVIQFFEKRNMNAKACMLEMDGFVLELWQFEDLVWNRDDLADIRIRGIRHLAFEVKNIDEYISQLRKRGLKVSKPEMGASKHRYSFTKDPNGIPLELYEK